MKKKKTFKLFKRNANGSLGTTITNYITKLNLHYWLFWSENRNNSKKNGLTMAKNKKRNWFQDSTKSGLHNHRKWVINYIIHRLRISLLREISMI